MFNSLVPNKEADVALGSFAFSEKRNRLIDYPYATLVDTMALMIPKPTAQQTNHFYVVFKPFELEVQNWKIEIV